MLAAGPVFWYVCTSVYSRFCQNISLRASLGSAGSFQVKGVSAKTEANRAWLASLADFLEPRYIRYSPFYSHRRAWSQAIHEKEVTWSLAWPLLEFSGRLYSIYLFDFGYWYLGARKWSVPLNIWFPKCGNLIPPFQKKYHFCLIVALIRLFPLGISM